MVQPLTHRDPQGHARMVDVGSKPLSQRRAVARGVVRMSVELVDAIAANRVAKGNLLETARLAGIQAAKRTSALIPLCHPLPLDLVQVDAWLEPPGVHLQATVETTWRTGVEMEALTAVSVAALTVIDMGKAVDRGMSIESVRLLEKSGGQHGDYRASAGANRPRAGHPASGAAVLTVSDRCSVGQATDTAGPALAHLLQARLALPIVAQLCVPDDPARIAQTLRSWASRAHPPELVLTTGGTGLSPRDHTPEATAAVVDRRHDALLALARQRCPPLSALSRGIAGTVGSTLVINLPGSQRGATETLEALLDVLPHALAILRGRPDAHSQPAPGREP